MASRKHASSKGKKTGVTVSVTLSGPDKEKIKNTISKIRGATVKGWKAKPISGTAKKVGEAVKKDLAGGRKRRDKKLANTRATARASAELDKRRKQKATRSRIAARKRKQSGAGGG